MAYCRQRDFLFCEMSGTMLSLDTAKYAWCPLCKFKKHMVSYLLIGVFCWRSVSRYCWKRDSVYYFSGDNERWPYIRDEVGHLCVDIAITLPKDIQRELGISSFDDFVVEKESKQMDYNANCKACQHVMSYVTMQTRSADEGQTIFYTCLKCGSKQTENSYNFEDNPTGNFFLG